MRFYLEYINYLGRLRKKNVIRRSESGFSIAEVLLAGLIMLIAILVAGIGVINLLSSNYRANADSEIQNNLNQTLEFVSNDVRRARIIADSSTRIVSTRVPTGGNPVLAFYIPSVSQPDQTINEQIVYYTKNPENNLTGPRVLWRYGPDLDENGNYENPENIGSWKHSPITDMLADVADATNNRDLRDCDPFRPGTLSGWQRIPANYNQVEGFYVCVRSGGRQVILNANAQVNMTTKSDDVVKYAVSTRVTTRATDELWFRPPSVGNPPVSVQREREPETVFDTPREIIIPTRPVEVIGKLIEEPPAQPCRDCFIGIRDPNNPRDLTFPFSRQSDATVQVRAGNEIIVSVQGGAFTAEDGDYQNIQNVDLYTYERQPISDSNSTSRHSLSETTRNMVLTRNQVLVVITDITTANKRTYVILVDITPST